MRVNDLLARDIFGIDPKRVQLALPFPDEKTIDMERCCSILHVNPWVVRRLMVTPLDKSSDTPCIFGYNTMPYAPLRIEYDSVVSYLNHLRELHGIPDRRPAPVFGRHRDDDLLPFRWSDTATVEEVSDILSLHHSKVRLRLEAGQYEAYKITPSPDSHWRISRESVARVLASLPARQRKERPYRR